MKIELEPGKYVVAVSGGIDSMTLLHLISQFPLPISQFVVAHFDHGIRPDSANDEKLVRKTSEAYGFDHESEKGNLGADASEDTARKARYDFLQRTREKYKADAIITAHHEDDKLESAIINLLRGSGFRGLCSLDSNSKLIRPLLSYSKEQIRAYARENNLSWVEDSTNEDPEYLRNYVRLKMIPQMLAKDPKSKIKMLAIIDACKDLVPQIDAELVVLRKAMILGDCYSRYFFIMLPQSCSLEMLRHIFNLAGVENINKKLLQRLVSVVKTAQPNTKHDIDRHNVLIVRKSDWGVVKRLG